MKESKSRGIGERGSQKSTVSRGGKVGEIKGGEVRESMEK